MFEFAKQNNKPNGMRYIASLLLSVLTHAVILCVMVTVPLIFCNTLHPEELVTWLIEPPPLPPPIPAPAPPHASSAGTVGKGHIIREGGFEKPKEIPDGIMPEPPTGDGFGNGEFDGLVPGGGISLYDAAGDRSAIDKILVNLTPPKIDPPKRPERKAAALVPIISTIQESKLIHKVIPPYPELARIARVSGPVSLMAIIDEEGNVTDLKVVSGHALLKDAALQAVWQWKYSPTVLNGEPVRVQAMVTIVFTLK
jgi:periplasmic protein TonB